MAPLTLISPGTLTPGFEIPAFGVCISHVCKIGTGFKIFDLRCHVKFWDVTRWINTEIHGGTLGSFKALGFHDREQYF